MDRKGNVYNSVVHLRRCRVSDFCVLPFFVLLCWMLAGASYVRAQESVFGEMQRMHLPLHAAKCKLLAQSDHETTLLFWT
ncbi:MAG: hypothetical protein WAV76_02955, partial [Bacteroidota bacterium]